MLNGMILKDTLDTKGIKVNALERKHFEFSFALIEKNLNPCEGDFAKIAELCNLLDGGSSFTKDISFEDMISCLKRYNLITE